MRAKVVVIDIAQPAPSTTLSSIPYTTNDMADDM